jgi:DNA-binding transcriptional ArsR family regulator
MVNYSLSSLDVIFSALSDPTRRAILERLARGEATVTEVAEPFNMTLPAISKHLRILENARLIVREKEGRVHHLRLSPAPLKTAAEWLAEYRQFWDEQLDSLADYLETTPEEVADDQP